MGVAYAAATAYWLQPKPTGGGVPMKTTFVVYQSRLNIMANSSKHTHVYTNREPENKCLLKNHSCNTMVQN